jgi:outer membrane protein TolC
MYLKSKILLAACSLWMLTTQAQEPVQLSLEQARTYAEKHNFELRNAEIDVQTAEYKVKETIATGLPQVSASVRYMDNIGLPVQLIPGDFFGQPGEQIEVQFGTKYSGSAGATVNQLLFNGSYLVGLQASKAYLRQSQKELLKNKIEVIQTVSEAYFMVLATKEGISIIDSTLAITQKLADQTKIIVENGFAEETELDQLKLLISDLMVSCSNSLNQLDITTEYLRYLLGLNDNQSIELTESFQELTDKLVGHGLIQQQFEKGANVDFQILQNQKELALLQVKLEQSAYLPNLSAFLNYDTQAQRQNWDFFDSKGKWYSSSVWGVTMNIPIFSSGERRSKVKQAKLQFEKTLVAEEMVSNNLSLQYKTTRSDLENALENYQFTQQNKEIAEKIFRRTGIKYSEGLAASLDLLNTQNQFLTAQSQYINATLNMLNRAVALEALLTRTE